ncbi:MAG: radical SAM protein [Lachnospiraceae bacterium]|nr:radical SAM protein [Lachnospiraceae bacterium]
MYYGSLKKNDVANGPGVRVNLFVSGCTHCCKKCFNEETWNFKFGELYTDAVTDEILEALAPPYVAGITFLGGEPMEPANRKEILKIAERVHQLYPYKSIWCFSGYLTEELLASAGIWDSSSVPTLDEIPRNRTIDCSTPAADAEELSRLLSLIDVLVDGEYVDEKRNLMLKFRGSENQRLVDLKKTIAEGKIILCE